MERLKGRRVLPNRRRTPEGEAMIPKSLIKPADYLAQLVVGATVRLAVGMAVGLALSALLPVPEADSVFGQFLNGGREGLGMALTDGLFPRRRN